MPIPLDHGGDLEGASERSDISASLYLDASASLAPWTPRHVLGPSLDAFRHYPDREQRRLKRSLSVIHGLPPSWFLPGNGAAELFTWAGRDAASQGLSSLASPCFADYQRALACWGGEHDIHLLPLQWEDSVPATYPFNQSAHVLWVCNPHNPSGQLWSRSSLERLLCRFQLVICDEAFLPLVMEGEAQSLIPLVAEYPNLVVIRSLTKLYGIAGVRLGYAVAHPDRLARWAAWRDPWPVNGLALSLGQRLLRHPERYRAWCTKVQRWTYSEGAWLYRQLSSLPVIKPLPSAANFLLIRADQSLVPLREALEQRHRILLRDCRSFDRLGENWLRIGYQSRRGNRRIIRALRKELLGFLW
jgi:histidinol-phosphate/aromatic aminotransferase/cobyric acid decarboxylase-like protein